MNNHIIIDSIKILNVLTTFITERETVVINKYKTVSKREINYCNYYDALR